MLAALALALAARAEGQARKLRVEIVGIRGAEARNVRAVLSIARAKPGVPRTLAEVRRLDQRAVGEIGLALEPFGFYQPVIVKTLGESGDRWLARYTISPGPAARIRKVDVGITGDGAETPIFLKAAAAFPLHQGDTLRHLPYEAWKLAVLTAASDSGYLKADFDTTAISLNRETGVADVLVRFSTGPRYRFGPVTFRQNVLDSSFLATRVPFRTGDLYRQPRLLQLESNLSEDPYFERVEVIPHPDSAVGLLVPIEVDLAVRRPQAYEVGAGYGTDNGPRGRLTANFRRLNRKGHNAQVELVGSFSEQSISTRYNIPAFGNPTGILTLQAGYGILNPNSTNSSRTLLLGPRLTRRRFGWRETLLLNYQRASFGVGVDSGVAKMLLAGATYERTRSDSRIFPTKGMRLRLNAQAANRSLLSNVSFVQAEVSGKLIFSPAPKLRILARADVGQVFTNELRSLPPTYRFFAGGDQSVRGYGYLELGPRDYLGNVIGGRALLVGSGEADYQFISRVAFAVFFDAGNAMDKLGLRGIEEGAGIGLRYLSPIGMLRVDGAFAVSEPGTPFKIHLSVGPDL